MKKSEIAQKMAIDRKSGAIRKRRYIHSVSLRRARFMPIIVSAIRAACAAMIGMGPIDGVMGEQ
jgi:hypothetical protein